MKWITGILSLLVFAMPVPAEGPVSPPPPVRDTGRMGGEHMRRPVMPTDAQWNEMLAFMKQHAPRRAIVLASMPSERAQRIKIFAYGRYKELMELQKEDPDIYNKRIHNMELEDAAFGLVMDIKKQTDPKQKEAMTQQLREKVAQIVQAWLDERQHRIEKVEQSLAKEKDVLAKNRKNIDELVKQRMDQIMKGDQPMRPDRPYGEGRRREGDEHSGRGKQGREN